MQPIQADSEQPRHGDGAADPVIAGDAAARSQLPHAHREPPPPLNRAERRRQMRKRDPRIAR